jgi:hypothetical protein
MGCVWVVGAQGLYGSGIVRSAQSKGSRKFPRRESSGLNAGSKLSSDPASLSALPPSRIPQSYNIPLRDAMRIVGAGEGDTPQNKFPPLHPPVPGFSRMVYFGNLSVGLVSPRPLLSLLRYPPTPIFNCPRKSLSESIHGKREILSTCLLRGFRDDLRLIRLKK